MPQPEDLAAPEAVMSGTLGEGNVLAAIEAEEAAAPHRRWKRPKGLRLLAAIWLIVVVGACALAPVLPLPDPEVSFGGIADGLFSRGILGTDQLGRDMLSRILWGGRTSCFVAGMTTLLASVTGMTLGIIAGYF